MTNITWEYVQDNADEILLSGLHELKGTSFQPPQNLVSKNSGNYLISLNQTPHYIGEGKNLQKRLKQQFKPKTSTFYKSFLESGGQASIENFFVQAIETDIGRKEIEEFGIVNLPAPLNKFQLDKRKKIETPAKIGLWREVQKMVSHLLKEAEQTVMKAAFAPWFDYNVMDLPGVYFVRNKSNDLIYIGESSDLGKRYLAHSGRTYFSALRRHIGTEILQYELQSRKGKKKYFTEVQDQRVTEYLGKCVATFCPVAFGRYELEEYLIRKHRPILNRKDNKD